MVIETIERAKSLSAPNVSAADLINLTKCLIEYEADVKSNVEFMVSGLTERAVFEFTKKKISGECMKTSPLNTIKHIILPMLNNRGKR